MKQPRILKSKYKPILFIPVDTGTCYNYDIKKISFLEKQNGEYKQVDGYSYIPIKINGSPTYDKCVKAIISEYITKEEELNYLNSYNSYQLGIIDIDKNYEKYLSLVQEIKDKVRKDFDIAKPEIIELKPRQADIAKFITMFINTMNLTDSQSLEIKSLYPTWTSYIGQVLKENTIVQYNCKLYRVLQEHIVQEQYPPSINTSSLYTEIIETNKGTLEDPIPYPEDGNMIIYSGKYYVEQTKVYKCIRDSQQPLYASLHTLIGNYVELIQ